MKACDAMGWDANKKNMIREVIQGKPDLVCCNKAYSKATFNFHNLQNDAIFGEALARSLC